MTAGLQENRTANWLHLLCSGDHQAFAEFVDQYQQMVFLCCRTLGLTHAQTEDVASETFLAAYRKLNSFRGQSKLSTWLWQIAYHKAVSYLRTQKKDRLVTKNLDDRLADRQPARISAQPGDQEHINIVWEAVQRLPPDWAAAVVLFYREQKSILEIAKITKKRQNTVKTYLFRARQRLKTELADHV